ncbi:MULTISPECIES: monovalent cation/H+ antiporter subunit D [unclassified Mesorhizobium]|uniref:monovalent cation/H+ antiporter subunit D n=1 Tax=unclassified Mesorhizobium TaxID=325217 RepID=UPI000FDA1588|nr:MULTISPECIES: monovalent cation/H+ antiporter subunit D [unclassified Mesorhizobium]TGT71981.1 monovalent cation/H+ antiporter subunit D [Mesorhizobium sp. M2E.F.Ca.ET.166.01.1.1]TGV99305.1 monovalent cation/H+ antiporter subunit D [Mesorhizobium sp. M2E.F.Ca.ET.154.01.1.1]
MMEWTRHLLVVPILLPLMTGALLLLIDESRHTIKALVSLASTVLLLVASVVLMRMATSVPSASDIVSLSYAVASWPAPFAIVLVLDRLSALMLVLVAVIGLASLVFSLARWHRAGPHFHTLFQFLLMGLAGAFLTGDLFNLFVFFEVTLAASYGLLLHGSGAFRVRSGLHYIAINLAASLLFLIGVSLIYGVAGTLNMADLALRLHVIPAGDRMLLQAGAAILGIAFLVKAGVWPLCFWLPSAYMAAAAPVSAIFVILTKVGVYVLLRLSLLLFGSQAGELTGFGGTVMLWGGMATVAFATSGVLASQAMGRLAGYSVLVSSGTLLAAVGMGDAAVVSGALFYLVSSTLTTAAFFMLIELVERAREPGADLLAVTREAYGDGGEDEEREDEEVGVVMPGALAILGVCFGCVALLLAGLPPLSGFVAKFAMLTGMLNLDGLGTLASIPPRTWLLVALVILSGLAALLAMMRSGIGTFWAPLEAVVPRVLVVEIAPVVALLALCLFLTVKGGAMIEYTEAAALSLHDPSSYIRGVLGSDQTKAVAR